MQLAFKHAIAAILLILSFAVPVVAGPLEDARTAHDKGDYKTALRLLRPLADQGLAVAQSNLGVMYAESQGVPQDYAEAIKWFRKAADQGKAKAELNLGHAYLDGHGVPQDYAEAMKWFRKAADQGDDAAQLNLGFMYYKGQGVPPNYVSAYMWFNLSAVQNNQDAIKSRDTVAQHMTPAQIAEAQKLAREWKPTTQPPATSSEQTSNSPPSINLADTALCLNALNRERSEWNPDPLYLKYITEASRRGLTVDSCRELLGEQPVTADSGTSDQGAVP